MVFESLGQCTAACGRWRRGDYKVRGMLPDKPSTLTIPNSQGQLGLAFKDLASVRTAKQSWFVMCSGLFSLLLSFIFPRWFMADFLPRQKVMWSHVSELFHHAWWGMWICAGTFVDINSGTDMFSEDGAAMLPFIESNITAHGVKCFNFIFMSVSLFCYGFQIYNNIF